MQRAIGSFGRYQLWLFFLISLTKFPVAYHQLGIVFLAPKVFYTCNGVEHACPCTNPVYNTSIFTKTIIMEWNLICNKKWLVSFTQTLFQLGVLIGSVFFGMASDRFGRKNPMIIALILQVIFGVVAAYASDYWTFTFIRFIIGTSVGGSIVISFVILMEYVGTKHRELISALYQAPFNMGCLTLPGFSYFFRDYFHFQLAISIPTIILLSYYFLLPESPRWLIAVKRTEEAIIILERVAKINKRPTQNIRADIETQQRGFEQRHLRKGTIFDLFRTPNMRKHILVMAFSWLTCSYCFYGVSQFVGHLSGNVFANSAAGGCVTLFGTLLAIPLLHMMGRRTIAILFNLICAFCLLVLAVLPEGIGTVICASLGIVASFVVFIIVFLYCSELFPTVVRNAAIGFSSMCARIGSMVAPFVIDTEDVAHWLPPILFAVFPLISACIILILPETKGCEFMTTIEEGERFGKATPRSEKT